MEHIEEDRDTLKKMGIMMLSYMVIVSLIATAVIVLT